MERKDLYRYCTDWMCQPRKPSLYLANECRLLVPELVSDGIKILRLHNYEVGCMMWEMWDKLNRLIPARAMHPIRMKVKSIEYNNDDSYNLHGVIDFYDMLPWRGNIIHEHIKHIAPDENHTYIFEPEVEYSDVNDYHTDTDLIRNLYFDYDTCCEVCEEENQKLYNFTGSSELISNLIDKVITAARCLV